MRRLPTHWIVLAASLLLTALAAAVAHDHARERDAVRFQNAMQSATDRITSRMDLYVALLRAGAGLFAAAPVSADEWHRYVERLDLERRFPGIQGMGFTMSIPADSVTALEARMRAAGRPGFRVWPDTVRAEYHAILYMEPLDRRNAAAIGYDLFTDPVRREAMERARDTGDAALSGRVVLVQEIEGPVQPGFLVYLPVYRGGMVPPTLPERRAALDGFVYAAFRAGDLFAGIFGREESPRVAFAVYDGSTPAPEALLYDSRGEEAAGLGQPVARGTVEMAGRPWTLAFRPTPAFSTGSRRSLVPLFLGIGLFASLLLFGLTRAQGRAHMKAERHAREAAELASMSSGQAIELERQMQAAQELNEELRSTNQALEAARQAAEEANRSKSHFLANMSHELRTPLNAIGGFVELIEMGIRGPVTEQQRADLERIKHAQRHLLGLINDVLNFAKLEAGKVQYHLKPVSVEGKLDDVEGLIAPMARAREISYAHDGAGADARVLADPDKLEQILLNLLSNSVKFTRPGGEIRVDWAARDGTVDIRVRDTGMGIPADRLASIFDPFVQVDSSLTRTVQGTGLGLAISRDLARGMDGDIEVESTEGEGSVFTLRLPAAPVASKA
ncbi:MAG TPA: CHASE domain-containing protein [Longimicrobiales bacterium]|nr:CHASE domain-containing protein [Longimicrobiales bacterium]